MSLDLPLEYRVMNAPSTGSKLNIAVLFPKGFELTNFEVLAEIIWKDLYWEEDWEGYRYGLKFIKILEEDRGKLEQILSGQFQLDEISSHA